MSLSSQTTSLTEKDEVQEIIDAFVEIIEAGYSIETWR
jgi:hypothetical protein